jgi:hypothetical protein
MCLQMLPSQMQQQLLLRALLGPMGLSGLSKTAQQQQAWARDLTIELRTVLLSWCCTKTQAQTVAAAVTLAAPAAAQAAAVSWTLTSQAPAAAHVPISFSMLGIAGELSGSVTPCPVANCPTAKSFGSRGSDTLHET